MHLNEDIAKICINRKKCQIIDETDIDFLRQLDNELSFMVQGAEYTGAFRGFMNEATGQFESWDGKHRLLSEDLFFSPGLLNRVELFFQTHNKPFRIVDNRPLHLPGTPVDILPKLKELDKVPYPHQLYALEQAKSNCRGIIRLATGSGKSLISALITAEFGKPTIIYVIGKDLLYQFHTLFSELFDQKIGIIGDGKCEVADINIATIWTVGQALGLRVSRAEEEEKEKKPEPEKFKIIRDTLRYSKLHILDECHLAACDTVQGIFRKINPENLYGMSASPWRDDGADLLIEAYLGGKIVDISAKKLIESGHLVKPLIKFLAVPPYPHRKAKHYKTLYSKYITNNTDRNSMVLKGTVKLVEQGFQTLVLFQDLKHGKILYNLISKNLDCEILSGKDSAKVRDKVKDKLASGNLRCILASKIFDIGIDLPTLSGLIVSSGGKSSVRALQRVGRVIRKAPGKNQAAVLDFADQAPWLLDHSKIRRDIYKEEFDVVWPQEEEKLK